MKTPSTADSREPSGLPVDPAADPAPHRRSTTHVNVKGQTAPRLPHERDESSDSGTAEPDPLMQQAHDDATSGKRSTDRGEVTDELYGRTLRGDQARYAGQASRAGTPMTTSRKKPASKESTQPSAQAPATLTPVTRKIGEPPGNLQGRSEAFKRRHGKTEPTKIKPA